MPEDDWVELLGNLYGSAFDPDAAARVPDGLSRLVGGGISAFWNVNPHTGGPEGRILSSLPQEAVAAYAAHYHRLDPWMSRFNRMEKDTPLRGSAVIPDSDLARSAYYNDFGRTYGTFHVLGVALPLGTAPDAPFAAAAVLRPQKSGAFEEADVQMMGRLIPHLRRAAQLGRVRLHPATDPGACLEAALAILADPAAVVDGAGHVLAANEAAMRLAARGVGFSLADRRSGRGLSHPEAATAHRLALAFANVAAGGAGGIIRLALTDGEVWIALVSPLPRPLAIHARLGTPAALFVVRPLGASGGEVMRGAARRSFGLTPAEADVAALLATGMSPSEIAQAREVKITTIRSLLSRATGKAEARDLRDLVRLMLALRG